MNGYELMAESYKDLLKRGEIDKTTAGKWIRIYEFLTSCDQDDICRLVDSSAFNDVIKAYVEIATKRADIDQDSKEKVYNQLHWLFKDISARQVLEDGGWIVEDPVEPEPEKKVRKVRL